MYKCFNLTPPPGDEEEDPEMYNFHQAVDMLQEAQDMLVDEHQQCISVRSTSCHVRWRYVTRSGVMSRAVALYHVQWRYVTCTVLWRGVMSRALCSGVTLCHVQWCDVMLRAGASVAGDLADCHVMRDKF